MRKITISLILGVGLLTTGAILFAATLNALHPAPESLTALLAQSDKIRLLDRQGEPLSITYQNAWNVHDCVALYEVPAFLQTAFIQAEDRRFYQHHGQDWQARVHALLQNIGGLRTVRGASTITEQVVRMLHPRPRTLWSKWLEGWEAQRLEQRFSKTELLQFYLNQVPYAAQRRGIVQASRYYFDRDLETLSKKEMLALAVLARAPSRLDIYRHPQAVEEPLLRLAEQMRTQQLLSDAEWEALQHEPFNLARPALDVEAQHFVRAVLQQKLPPATQLQTTLDAPLQVELQGVLDQQLQNLRSRHVVNGGLLVADHQNGEVLAWVVAGGGAANKPAAAIDTVSAPRQPGSSMKPFLYAQALEKGWTAATLIEDAPLTEMIGQGLHRYHNYSRVYYGWVSVREALGNSLNISALKAIQYVGVEPYLALLKILGFRHLTQHPNIYGDGLALGNAEVSLFEMVQAYATLANRGVFRPLRVLKNTQPQSARRVFSETVASLLGNILSDPDARQLEFGAGTVLNLPVQTAVKTGTSSDFRDSWVFGYNDRYVVGVWMGNLDNTATDGVTGSAGPALVLRSAFALLNRQRDTQPLYLSPQLLQKTVCKSNGRLLETDKTCPAARSEYFVPGRRLPENPLTEAFPPIVRLRQPLEGLQIAVDPRVPLNKQALEFIMQGAVDSDAIEWRVDGQSLGVYRGGRYLWPLRRGKHVLQAQVTRDGKTFYQSPQVAYWVK